MSPRAADQSLLPDEWRKELAGFRSGEIPDWRRWSNAGRANWAKGMLKLARDEGFDALVTADERRWLESVGQTVQAPGGLAGNEH